jgi:hypothetical protein
MEEREYKPKATEDDEPDVEGHKKLKGRDDSPKDEEPDVEAHKKLKGRDDSPTIEREKLSFAGDDDDQPDVEAHVKPH